MFESISLKFTELPEPLRFPAQGVTVFVGPNNSGKSLVLRELEQDISTNLKVETKIVDDFEITWINEDRLNQDIENLTKKAPLGTPVDHIHVGRFNPGGELESDSVHYETLRRFMSGRTEKRWLTSHFLRFFLIRLDGRTRFRLTNDQPRGDLLGNAQNMLMHLFQNNDDRKRVREVVFDAFGMYFTIEQMSAENFRIRLSLTEPDENEQNWNEAARAFHGKALRSAPSKQ